MLKSARLVLLANQAFSHRQGAAESQSILEGLEEIKSEKGTGLPSFKVDDNNLPNSNLEESGATKVTDWQRLNGELNDQTSVPKESDNNVLPNDIVDGRCVKKNERKKVPKIADVIDQKSIEEQDKKVAAFMKRNWHRRKNGVIKKGEKEEDAMDKKQASLKRVMTAEEEVITSIVEEMLAERKDKLSTRRKINSKPNGSSNLDDRNQDNFNTRETQLEQPDSKKIPLSPEMQNESIPPRPSTTTTSSTSKANPTDGRMGTNTEDRNVEEREGESGISRIAGERQDNDRPDASRTATPTPTRESSAPREAGMSASASATLDGPRKKTSLNIQLRNNALNSKSGRNEAETQETLWLVDGAVGGKSSDGEEKPRSARTTSGGIVHNAPTPYCSGGGARPFSRQTGTWKPVAGPKESARTSLGPDTGAEQTDGAISPESPYKTLGSVGGATTTTTTTTPQEWPSPCTGESARLGRSGRPGPSKKHDDDGDDDERAEKREARAHAQATDHDDDDDDDDKKNSFTWMAGGRELQLHGQTPPTPSFSSSRAAAPRPRLARHGTITNGDDGDGDTTRASSSSSSAAAALAAAAAGSGGVGSAAARETGSAHGGDDGDDDRAAGAPVGVGGGAARRRRSRHSESVESKQIAAAAAPPPPALAPRPTTTTTTTTSDECLPPTTIVRARAPWRQLADISVPLINATDDEDDVTSPAKSRSSSCSSSSSSDSDAPPHQSPKVRRKTLRVLCRKSSSLSLGDSLAEEVSDEVLLDVLQQIDALSVDSKTPSELNQPPLPPSWIPDLPPPKLPEQSAPSLADWLEATRRISPTRSGSDRDRAASSKKRSKTNSAEKSPVKLIANDKSGRHDQASADRIKVKGSERQLVRNYLHDEVDAREREEKNVKRDRAKDSLYKCNNIAEEMDMVDTVPPASAETFSSSASGGRRGHHHLSPAPATPGVFISHRHSMSQDSNDSGGSSSSGMLMLAGAGGNPPPTYSRLPPDGHEFPPDYKDPGISARTSSSSLILSRKSSASSTGSLDKPASTNANANVNVTFATASDLALANAHHAGKSNSSKSLRHDEHSMKSVRDKIALFSHSGPGSGSGAKQHQSTEDLGSSQLLTRAHTHGDVRFVVDGGTAGNGANSGGGATTGTVHHRSMTNVSHNSSRSMFMSKEVKKNGKSISSADLHSASTDVLGRHRILSHDTPTNRHRIASGGSGSSVGPVGGRSQSLMEIGNVSSLHSTTHHTTSSSSTSSSSSSSGHSQTLPKRNTSSASSTGCSPKYLEQQRRRNTVSKIGKEYVMIPEQENSTPRLQEDDEDLSQARQISLNSGRISINSSSASSSSSSSSSSTWKSGAPLPTKYSPAYKRKPFTVYGGSSSDRRLSATAAHGASTSSPKTSPESRKQERQQRPVSSPSGKTEQKKDDDVDGPRLLKKNSVEALNRKNVLESSKLRSGGGMRGGPSASSTSSLASPSSSAANATTTSISEFRAIEAREMNRMSSYSTASSSSSSFASLGKPASRSSSFTIAERKKSFEAMSSRLSTDSRRGSHSSQDSLASLTASTPTASSRRSSRDALLLDNGSTSLSNSSRRSSRDTICEEDFSRRSSRSEADGGSRVTTPTKSATPTEDRSLTPTNAAEKRPLSRTSSLASERSTSSNRSGDKTAFGRTNSVVSKDSGLPEEDVINESPPSAPKRKSDYQTPLPHEDRWSTLEKKYSSKSLAGGDTKNKIAKFTTQQQPTPSVVPESPPERPRDLSLTASSPSASSTPVSSSAITGHQIRSPLRTSPGEQIAAATGNSTILSPGSRAIRNLTEKFEEKSSTSSVTTTTTAMTTDSSDVLRKESVVSNCSSAMDGSDASERTTFRLGEATTNYASWLLQDDMQPPPGFYIPDESAEWESFDPATPMSFSPGSAFAAHSSVASSSTTHATATATLSSSSTMSTATSATSQSFSKTDRKYSVPVYSTSISESDSNAVKMRDKKEANAAPSRPSSLIETAGGCEMKVFEMGHLGDHRALLSNSTSRDSSQADLLDGGPDTPLMMKSPMSSRSAAGSATGSCASRELLEVFGYTQQQLHQKESDRRSVSVNDIRRAFEKAEQSLSSSLSRCSKSSSSSSSGGGGMVNSHHRMSSLDSTASDESSIPTPQHCYGSVSSLLSGQNNLKDHYGSITSLASSTSLISPQELQGLIDEANQSLEESGTPSHEIMVIVLHREFTSGSIGITLAGGADYESKDITVHKVIPGTLADRDGRIQKGDRVLSINGRSTKGVTHREALSILKAPRAEVVLVLSRSRSVTPAENGCYESASASSSPASASASSSYSASYSYVNLNSGRPPKILESPLDSKSLLSDLKFVDVPRGPAISVILKKEGTGLGFSLEGGKDSPLGDRPLTIKKIFTGGAADKSKVLKVGDEIISVNSTDCTRMSRIEAWNFMKKLSDGTANLVVRQKKVEAAAGATAGVAAAASNSGSPADGLAAKSQAEGSDADAGAGKREDTAAAAAQVERTRVEETKQI